MGNIPSPSKPNKTDRHNTAITHSRYLLITDLENSIDKETLTKHLEVALDCQNQVQKIFYGRSADKVVAIFTDPVNPKYLETLLRKKIRCYHFETIKEPTVVQVLNIPQGDKNLHTVKLYLTNEEMSGGTMSADFYRKPEPKDGFCLMDLKSPEVVKRVCKREHYIIGGKKNCILPYFDNLGLAVNFGDRPNDQRSEKLVLKGIDEEKLRFINEKMKNEFQDFLKRHHIELVDQSLNSLTFCRETIDEAAALIGTEWKTSVEKMFREIFLQLCVEKLEIKEERKWLYLQDKREEFCKNITAVTLYEDTCHHTFTLVSRRSDETSLKHLKGIIESEEPPEEPVIDIVDGFSSMKLRAFEAIGFKNEVESNTRVELNIHVNDGKIEVIGFKNSNHKAKIEIIKKLGSLQEKNCVPPNDDYIEILKSPQLIEQCNREIEKKNLRGTWGITSDGDNNNVVVCYEFNEKDTFKKIETLIFSVLETGHIVIDGEMEHKDVKDLSTQIRNIENSLEPFVKVKILENPRKHIRITCRKDLITQCRQQLQNFINHHTICTCGVSIKAAIADYMHDEMNSQIEQAFLVACGNSPVWTFRDSKFYVTGNQIVRSKCTEVLYMLASKVIVKWKSITHKGIQKYFTIGAGKNMESEVTNCHLKILRQDEFQKQKIRAVALTEEGHAICMGVMDLYKQPVDGLVNVMNEDLQHFKKGGIEVEREISDYIEAKGKLTDGQVFITGPGTLPCFKILHAVAPIWRGGTENEDKILEQTIENVLSMADSKSLRSIAMPLVACSSLFGYPIKRACGILLQTIIKLCQTMFKSIREIYICDMNSDKIEQFKQLAEGMFGSQFFYIPLGQNLTLGKSIALRSDKNCQERWQILVQRRGIRTIPLPAGRKVIIAWGNLAKLSHCTPPLKADIIVNPTTTFPVLTGDIANGLKAATSNGGKFDLDSECKKKEPKGGLQNGSYVATDTPYMPCDQILHLKIEPSWKNINEEILKTYIKTCMNYALLTGKKTIAFPTIGTGKIGYPGDAVARCFVHAIAEFSKAQSSGSLEEVIIVIYHRDSETTLMFEQELQSLLAKRPHRPLASIEDEIKAEILEDEEDETDEIKQPLPSSVNHSPSSPVQIGTYQLRNGGNLTFKYGSLESSEAEALVSPTSGLPKLNGVIPSAIKKSAGGTTIEDELQRKYGKGVKVGHIAITGAGKIPRCKKVYHLKLEDYNSQKGGQTFLIFNSVKICLSQADSDGVSSVAFPTIGTGGFKYPAQLVADETLQAVDSYFNSRKTWKSPLHVNIVIFSQNSPEDVVFRTTAKNKLGLGGSSPRLPAASVDGDKAGSATFSSVKVELLPGKLENAKDLKEGGKLKKKGVRFSDNEDVDVNAFTEKETSIDHENRDFVLLKFISDSTNSTDKAFQSIQKKIEDDFLGYDPLKHEMIGHMRQNDIQEIEIICRKLDVEVEVSKENKEIYFEGTVGNVRKANEKVLEVIKALHDVLQNKHVRKLVGQYFEWCYEEERNILIPYPRKIGIELEIAFTSQNKTCYFTDTDGQTYCVDFSKNIEFEVNNTSSIVKVVRLDRMTGDLEPLPANWDKNDTSNLEVVSLQTTDKEYLDVQANFMSTVGSYTLKQIHAIKSIRNRTMFQQYALKRRFTQHQNPMLQSVEMILWHGTAFDNVDKINLNGFNRSFAGQTFGGKVWYGKGVYFSTRSEYGCDDNYTKRDARGHKYIYQCKVLTGNSTVVTLGYSERYPPTDPTTGMKFDSTSSPNMDEYVIYSDTQAYPAYLIEFE
ncbi:hypothetical protein CHS0354_024457 [Potamilus streckersoni]|uniref:Poly [ADP-ribose] polymerase n=1 Tax=Potamilus streckersoni TaxID=2493646 RepID=A0AAE0TL53_9BIVA|nr:hypothetical protein CHS0354_024457 [Potamilus streckersoni]